MNNEIELTFTPWQLFAIVGAICLIVLTIYIVGLLIEARKLTRQINETVHNVNDIVEDIQATKMVIVSRIAEIKKISDIVNSFKEAKEKVSRKNKKKSKKKEK